MEKKKRSSVSIYEKNMIRFFLGILVGGIVVFFLFTQVLLEPRNYAQDCEVYADALFSIEPKIAKIIADCNENERIYKKQVENLCLIKGRLPNNLSTTTYPFPNIIWNDWDKKWLMEHAGAYTPLF